MAKHGGFAGGMPGMNMNNLMKKLRMIWQRKNILDKPVAVRYRLL